MAWNNRKGGASMCTPSVGIRKDGKGFWVRKGGVDIW